MDIKQNQLQYKKCFVPYCTNKSINNPNKIFIHLPSDYKQRELWHIAAKRKPKPNILKKTEYCCEDHFDLPNDMQNWLKYQLMPNTPKIMKKGVVPHKFDCQLSALTITNDGNKNKKQKLDVTHHSSQSTKIYKSSVRCLFNGTNIKDIKNSTLDTTINLIEKQSDFYIGIPKNSYFIINILCTKLNTNEKHILLCLEKIKRDIGMVALANDFVTSKYSAIQNFIMLVPQMAKELKKYILWPSHLKILENLPRNFRLKYSKVQSIITCLEISIPEPSSSLKKNISWSETKKSYTHKYLISCTLDGLVTFVSTGFGGKVSDSLMLEVSGFLDVLPTGCLVLTDHFKNGYDLLHEKGCLLIDVPLLETSSFDFILRRFREFSFLQPYSFIDNSFLCVLDDIVLIVAGLINLQQINT